MQAAYLRPFIEKMTNLRRKAPNTFDGALWKLCGNAFYGKLIERIHGRTNLCFTTRAKIFKHRVESGLCQRVVPISDNFVCLFMQPKTALAAKPVAAGCGILDLSKLLMYSFWYKHDELIDTSWIDETTKEDELSLVAAFKSTMRSYVRKCTQEGVEFARAYISAPGGRWVVEEDGERKWRSAALQGCPKALRKKLAQKNYLDLDIVGAAPCLMMTLARTYGLEDAVPHLKELARDIKLARRTICESSGCTMEEAKRNINMVLHGSPHRQCKGAFLSALREESL
ncbi:hypothetical protein T492DRAFT_858123 [Pavlovales sp. CCMP2436]|nr:hypothetical protein T492DRAFT_858123 [Pavlovales sp. CCMP2436]